MSSPLRARASARLQRAAAPSPGSPAGSPARARRSGLAALGNARPAIDIDADVPLPAELTRQWDASANKLLRPAQVSTSSVRLVNWRCHGCGSTFRKRVRDHVADGGCCPSCGRSASDVAATRRSPTRPSSSSPSTISAHRRERDQPMKSLEPQHRDGRLLSPMLAHTWEKYVDRLQPRDDVFLSRKLDGVRCIAAWDPVAKAPFFVSRVGNTFESCDWIADAIRPAFERDPSLVLDGEIYNHSVPDFSGLIGAIKVQRKHRTAEHEDLQKRLQFHAFDVLYSTGMNGAETPFATRLSVLERILNRVPTSKADTIKLVENDVVRVRDVERRMNAVLADGYEGLMARTATGTYEFGKRSTTLLKVKRMHDAEFEVVDVIEGKGRLRGMVGAIECIAPNQSPKSTELRTFRAGFGVADELRKEFWRHRDSMLVGKRVTVRYQELTPNGVPRFGQFKCVRSDADGSGFV